MIVDLAPSVALSLKGQTLRNLRLTLAGPRNRNSVCPIIPNILVHNVTLHMI